MLNIKQYVILFALCITGSLYAQNQTFTPEMLWQLHRLSAKGFSQSGNQIIYSLTTPDIAENDFTTTYYALSLTDGKSVKITDPEKLLDNPDLSPNGKLKLFHKAVKIEKVLGGDYYPQLEKSDAHIYHSLDYRHWDHWNTGEYNHVFYTDLATGDTIDIMPGEPYYCPQAPFGGSEDYTWGPESKAIYYVSKKVKGTEYATSTNTDIYRYDISSGSTINLTSANDGYDTHPQFSPDGTLAYLQMNTPGYEADKNNLIVAKNGIRQNLTANWDGTVYSYIWGEKSQRLYFTAPIDGTIQLFTVNYPGRKRIAPLVEQLSEGTFDVTDIIGLKGNTLYVTRTDMNHAADIYAFDLESKEFKQLTHVNKEIYSKIKMPLIKKKYVTTVDGKEMLVWVIYPPEFDPAQEYPTLLYAQGGPQSPLSQFYSYRWNFQLMASQGYIIVAPNRRGMPGHGVKWNEEISGDWGGLAMQDYLSAIDALAQEPYVDKDRIGAIGASFGGYSIFYLAGHHEGRFKTFIAHDGVFNTRSMYGTTEELFFVNHDLGGPYWEKDNTIAQKGYHEFNPINYVQNWDTPIMIIQGGKDYRVPLGQGLEAFTAAQMLGIKSKLLYFPSENHWVLSPQNGLVWQKQFFSWLAETL